MPYELKVIPKGTYLHLKVTGENTPENLAGYLTEGLRTAIQLDCPYVLVEEYLEGPELDLEIIREIIDEVRFAAAQNLAAVAFVNVNPEHSPDLTRFAENLATMRRINIRMFRTLEEAERWIQAVSRDRKQAGDG